MTSATVDMLKRLASGVRPDGTTSPRTLRPIEGRDFADLMAEVREGKIQSGRPVRLSGDLATDLTDMEQRRLAEATDAAEMAGVQTLLAIASNRILTVNVDSRVVERTESEAAGQLLTDLEAIVIIPDDEETAIRGRVGMHGDVDSRQSWRRSWTGPTPIPSRAVTEMLQQVGSQTQATPPTSGRQSANLERRSA